MRWLLLLPALTLIACSDSTAPIIGYRVVCTINDRHVESVIFEVKDDAVDFMRDILNSNENAECSIKDVRE